MQEKWDEMQELRQNVIFAIEVVERRQKASEDVGSRIYFVIYQKSNSMLEFQAHIYWAKTIELLFYITCLYSQPRRYS